MPRIEKKEKRRLHISRHEVVTYSYGDAEEVLFLFNGGPALPCDYLREPMLRMVEVGFAW